MYALIDCHDFYCSVEAVMRPALRDHPFVVLSSNDGCVVSRSQKARDLGVKMGVPWFQLADFQRHHGLMGLSSNMVLYSDFSTRFHSLVSGLAEKTFAYSVDEAFAFMDMRGDHTQRVWQLKNRIMQWLGLPVGGGIGKTKTLAKLASHVSKQAFRRKGSYPEHLAQVCNLGQCDPALLKLCMERTPIGEVWGIGRRYSDALAAAGIMTAWQFSKLDPAAVRKRFGVGLERTLRELNGVDCIELTGHSNRRQIVVSRSLATPATTLVELERLVSLFAAHGASKMRLQGSVCPQLSVFAMTSPFRAGPRYARSATVPVGQGTDDTRELSAAAVRAMRSIWEPGHDIAKCGIVLNELMPRVQVLAQGSLDFDLQNDGACLPEKNHKLMLAMDTLNARFGRKTVRVAAEETMAITRAERRTPHYTTSWGDIPVVRC